MSGVKQENSSGSIPAGHWTLYVFRPCAPPSIPFPIGDTTPLTNLVFMGMGEPLHNTDAVLAATDIVSHYLGLHISHNKVSAAGCAAQNLVML